MFVNKICMICQHNQYDNTVTYGNMVSGDKYKLLYIRSSVKLYDCFDVVESMIGVKTCTHIDLIFID